VQNNTTTTTNVTTTTVQGNQAPTIPSSRSSGLASASSPRFRGCDDGLGRLTVIERDNKRRHLPTSAVPHHATASCGTSTGTGSRQCGSHQGPLRRDVARSHTSNRAQPDRQPVAVNSQRQFGSIARPSAAWRSRRHPFMQGFGRAGRLSCVTTLWKEPTHETSSSSLVVSATLLAPSAAFAKRRRTEGSSSANAPSSRSRNGKPKVALVHNRCQAARRPARHVEWAHAPQRARRRILDPGRRACATSALPRPVAQEDGTQLIVPPRRDHCRAPRGTQHVRPAATQARRLSGPFDVTATVSSDDELDAENVWTASTVTPAARSKASHDRHRHDHRQLG